MGLGEQFCPPAPTFTEENLVDLSQKVYIVTGAAAGVGLELAKILYGLHATVYIGARSAERVNDGVLAIKQEHPNSKGQLKPFIADLSDLKSLKPAVNLFLSQEHRLDVLFLNAGVMTPPAGSKTKDGYDMELGTNSLSSFLLVKLLLPVMEQTSAHFCHPDPSVRVVWVCSCFDVNTAKGGVQLDSNGAPKQLKGMEHYMQSKTGLYFLAREFAKSAGEKVPQNQYGNQVMHVALHPGFMKTELQRNMPAPVRAIMGAVMKGPKYGAYTELYAGFAPDVQTGGFYWPWGRKGVVPDHVEESTVAPADGGKSVAARFYDWCEYETKAF
ncbi:short-chain dehydrogenase, partial [Polyplosphaeria fusca]